MNNQELRSKRDGAQRNETPSNDNSGSMGIEQHKPVQPVAGVRRLRGLPWAWLVLSGVATLGWLIVIGWAAVKVFRWLTD